MTNIEDNPAGAFDELRREISVMVRALQGLTAEHDKLPDYTKTLEAIDTKLGVFATNLGALAKTPALQFTPGALAGEIERASAAARAKDSELLRSAHLLSDRLMAELRGTLAQIRDARRQQQHMIWAAAAGIAFGILLWAILPGALVRSLPASWRAPEWMAARVIGTDEATAARRLLKLPAAAASVRSPQPLPRLTPIVQPRKHRHARKSTRPQICLRSAITGVWTALKCRLARCPPRASSPRQSRPVHRDRCQAASASPHAQAAAHFRAMR